MSGCMEMVVCFLVGVLLCFVYCVFQVRREDKETDAEIRSLKDQINRLHSQLHAAAKQRTDKETRILRKVRVVEDQFDHTRQALSSIRNEVRK